MGFASFFESLSNTYHGLKNQVSNLYHKGKDILHSARGGLEWFDEQLNKASSIPFLNTLVQTGKDFLQYDTVKSVIQDLDNIAQSGEIEAYGGMLDQAISGGLQAGQAIGYGVDQYFGGATGSPPNSSVAGGGRQTMSVG